MSNRQEGGLLLDDSGGDDLSRGLNSSGADTGGGDGADLREVVGLGHDGSRRLSGGLLGESESRQNSQEKLGEMHCVGWLMYELWLWV